MLTELAMWVLFVQWEKFACILQHFRNLLLLLLLLPNIFEVRGSWSVQRSRWCQQLSLVRLPWCSSSWYWSVLRWLSLKFMTPSKLLTEPTPTKCDVMWRSWTESFCCSTTVRLDQGCCPCSLWHPACFWATRQRQNAIWCDEAELCLFVALPLCILIMVVFIVVYDTDGCHWSSISFILRLYPPHHAYGRCNIK